MNGSFAYNDSELIIKEGFKTRVFHFIAALFQEVMERQRDLDNLLGDYYLIKVFNGFIYLRHYTGTLVVVKRDSLQIVQNIATNYYDHPRNICVNK